MGSGRAEGDAEADARLRRRQWGVRRIRWCHELADRLEDHLELTVVLLFEVVQPLGQILVGGDQFSQAHEGTHDLDVHLDCSLAL